MCTSTFIRMLSLSVKKANRTNGTFGFSNTQANAQKPKELFFSNARQKTTKK